MFWLSASIEQFTYGAHAHLKSKSYASFQLITPSQALDGAIKDNTLLLVQIVGILRYGTQTIVKWLEVKLATSDESALYHGMAL